MRRIISAFAILWLIGAGFLILTTGAALAWQEITRTDSCTGIECGLRQLFLIVDLVGIAFGAGYAAAGIGLWRGRPRAQDLVCILAFVGFLLASPLVPRHHPAHRPRLGHVRDRLRDPRLLNPVAAMWRPTQQSGSL